jgi:signal transduction histidine kinase
MNTGVSSPTNRLLAGLAVTLAAVAFFSLYTLHQIAGLRNLQTRTVDRNRKDSLQLLRIQRNLNELGLAMRDMLDGYEPYPLEAWRGQFERIRVDLEDALRIEARLTPGVPGAPGAAGAQRQYIASSLAQFWTSVDQLFTISHDGGAAQARTFIRTSLQAQQAALTNAVARLLVENNETEQQAVEQIQGIYGRVEQQVYTLLAAALLAISLTSLYMIRSNRAVFDRLSVLSHHRSELARKLITIQEEMFHQLSRELHDEFGQILTAIGAMLSRAERKGLPPDSPFRVELQEVREVAQSTMEKIRSLSQVLHPTILDDGGLEKAIDWYLPTFEKQTGIVVKYEKVGTSPEVPDRVAINVYRVLQEALNNMAKHSESHTAWVRVAFAPDRLRLEVEDHGVGIPDKNGAAFRAGTGMVAMRERVELLHGKIDFLKPGDRGTLVRLEIPLTEGATK